MTEPSQNRSAVSGLRDDEELADGRPNSRHTYDGLAYIAHADRLFAQGGILWQFGHGSRQTWTFDFSNDTWRNMKPSGTAPNVSAGMLSAYDRNTKLVYIFDRNRGFHSYDFDTNTYTLLNDAAPSPNQWQTATIDPKRKRFVAIGQTSAGGRTYVFDLAPDGTYAAETWTTTGANEIESVASPGLAYDPVSDRIIAWGTRTTPSVNGDGSSVYALDLDTRVWTRLTFPGGPGAESLNGVFGRFEYVPALNIFVLANSPTRNVQILRLPRPPGR